MENNLYIERYTSFFMTLQRFNNQTMHQTSCDDIPLKIDDSRWPSILSWYWLHITTLASLSYTQPLNPEFVWFKLWFPEGRYQLNWVQWDLCLWYPDLTSVSSLSQEYAISLALPSFPFTLIIPHVIISPSLAFFSPSQIHFSFLTYLPTVHTLIICLHQPSFFTSPPSALVFSFSAHFSPLRFPFPCSLKVFPSTPTSLPLSFPLPAYSISGSRVWVS